MLEEENFIIKENSYILKSDKNIEYNLNFSVHNNDIIKIKLIPTNKIYSKKYVLSCTLEELKKNRFFKLFVNVDEIFREFENKIQFSTIIEETNIIYLDIPIGLNIIKDIILEIKQTEITNDDIRNELNKEINNLKNNNYNLQFKLKNIENELKNTKQKLEKKISEQKTTINKKENEIKEIKNLLESKIKEIEEIKKIEIKKTDNKKNDIKKTEELKINKKPSLDDINFTLKEIDDPIFPEKFPTIKTLMLAEEIYQEKIDKIQGRTPLELRNKYNYTIVLKNSYITSIENGEMNMEQYLKIITNAIEHDKKLEKYFEEKDIDKFIFVCQRLSVLNDEYKEISSALKKKMI